MLVKAFRDTIFPYLVQIGVILFVYNLACLSYSTFRHLNLKELLDKLKSYFLAYALVKGSWAIVAFIDKVIDGIK